MRLVDNWRAVLKRAWPVRLMVIEALLSGLEVAMPFLADLLPIRPGLFALLPGLTVTGAFIARFVTQWTITPRARSHRL